MVGQLCGPVTRAGKRLVSTRPFAEINCGARAFGGISERIDPGGWGKPQPGLTGNNRPPVQQPGALVCASRIVVRSWVAVKPGLWARLALRFPRLSRIWSGRAESNCRPPGPKPGALPLGHAPTSLPDSQAFARRWFKSPHRKGGWGTSSRKRGLGGFPALHLWYPRRGSNSRLRLRRPALYPLSYRGTHQAKNITVGLGLQPR